MFEANDTGKGGSFYLQSKIVRARERLEQALENKEMEFIEDVDINDRFKVVTVEETNSELPPAEDKIDDHIEHDKKEAAKKEERK